MRAVARSVAAARLVVADKVVEVPTMEAAQAPQPEADHSIRKSSGRRGGRAGAEAEEGDEPGCEGVEALGVRWPRANPRVAVCFR